MAEVSANVLLQALIELVIKLQPEEQQAACREIVADTIAEARDD